MFSFENKKILVTGGTGSLGRTFVHRVLSGELGTPRKVIVFSRDEAKQHDMRMSYLNKTVSTEEIIYRNFMNVLEFRIGDIRNYSDVCAVVKNADIIVNAAAMKQVPTCEYFPFQAVLTNIHGPSNIVRAIQENNYPVETVIAISTDKACKPINVMGMTKSIQERIVTAANILVPNTRFISVRYGNVLASRGSVIPLFHEQIRNGGPVSVTVPEMTRFLLNLNQAVDTVIAAFRDARPGETFIPDAPSATALNIAQALINNRKIDIKIIGIRPGEKIHEILVSEEEVNHCVKRGDYFVIRPMLPELNNSVKSEPNALTKEFSSADRVLDLEGTIALLKKHHLMIEDVDLNQERELLR
ncbi:MAG: polysaccharide biosynthesis protein [Thermodesulfobacteriota bacterium]